MIVGIYLVDCQVILNMPCQSASSLTRHAITMEIRAIRLVKKCRLIMQGKKTKTWIFRKFYTFLLFNIEPLMMENSTYSMLTQFSWWLPNMTWGQDKTAGVSLDLISLQYCCKVLPPRWPADFKSSLGLDYRSALYLAVKLNLDYFDMVENRRQYLYYFKMLDLFRRWHLKDINEKNPGYF